MSDIRFTEDHEWIGMDGDIATVGITDYAQQQLGDVVYVELPEAGRKVTKGGDAAIVESVKAASEVYAPVDGEVTEANAALSGNPALVNSAPMGEGWFFKIRVSDKKQVAALMTEAAYKTFIAGLK